MHILWATTTKDLRRHLRDPVTLLVWAGIPLMVAFLLQLAFGGDGEIPEARLLVADQDETAASHFFTGALDGGPLGELIDLEPTSAAEGRRKIDAGDASGFLVIPEGFGQALLDEEPITLTLWTNPAQPILPRILEEVLATMVDATHYLQRVFGTSLRSVAAATPPPGAVTLPDSFIAAQSVTINRTMERVAPYLAPPAIQLEVTEGESDTTAGEPEVTLGALFLPGMLFLGILFVAQGMSQDLWRERSLGTLRRVSAAPVTLASILGGKVLAGTLILTGLAVVGLTAGLGLFRVEAVNAPLALGWCALFGTMMLLLLGTVHMLAAGERAANLLSSLILFPLAMLGGSFFPLAVMPGWMARIGRWTPNGWALERLIRILTEPVDPAVLAMDTLWMMAAVLVLFVLAWLRLHAGFARA